ncbi:dentin sialophosphoprotein-like [Oppia nitens]|uniref:dentin sialophosphoprotein-like n=1 Tax=Oppia nitens TaxID=1686743 RepID=UPI0023DBEDAF|nr:dentin sialophosphoprotein-like [Oppia nitens]
MFLSFEKRLRRTGGFCTCNHNEGLIHQNCHMMNGMTSSTIGSGLSVDRMYGSTSALNQRSDQTGVNMTTNLQNKSSCQSIKSVSNIPKLLSPLQCRPENNNRSSFHSHTYPDSTLGQTNSSNTSASTPVLTSAPLRRQISLSHLEGQTSTAGNSKPHNSRSAEGGLGGLHQRIRAMLLPAKDSSKTKTNQRNTNQSFSQSDTNETLSVNQNTDTTEPMANSTYSSQTVVYPNVSSQVDNSLMDNYNTFDDENDSFHIRDVCSKWFSQTKCPINQTLTSQMASAMTKPSLLDTSPKLSHNMKSDLFDKVIHKDTICHNSYTSTTNTNNQSFNGSDPTQLSTCSPSSSSSHFSSRVLDDKQQTNNECDITGAVSDRHVVVVSDLECDINRNTLLTVRSDVPAEDVLNVNTAITTSAYQDIQNNGYLVQISDQRITDSMTSPDHNYKSSSDSGRGTVRSRHTDNANKNDSPCGTSPLDLTSLDSDQSVSAVKANAWVEDSLNQTQSTDSMTSNEKIEKMQKELQRILEDNHSVQSIEVDVDDLSRGFKTRLSIVNESDSWTSNTPSQVSHQPQKGTTSKYADYYEAKADCSKSGNAMKNTGCKTYETNKNKQKCSVIDKQITNSNKPNLMNDKNKYPAQRSSSITKTMQMPNTSAKRRSNDRSHYGLANRGAKHRFNHSIDKNKDRFRNLVDCDILSTTTARDSTYADDLSSEYTANTSLYEQQDVYSIRKQLQGLENMYSEILGMMGPKARIDGTQRTRRKVCRSTSSIISGRSSVTSRGARDMYYRRYRYDVRKSKPDESHSSRRLKRLETHVITLARSVAQLSTEMRYNHSISEEMENFRQEMHLIREQMLAIKQNISTGGFSMTNKQQSYHQSNGYISANGRRLTNQLTNHHIINPNKVEKLKKFFGDEPPLLRQFLKKLGYEKYARNFESEKIGITELPYLSEERLQKLGIPLGPRMRIMQESHPQYKHNNNNHNNDNYSIYGIV